MHVVWEVRVHAVRAGTSLQPCPGQIAALRSGLYLQIKHLACAAVMPQSLLKSRTHQHPIDQVALWLGARTKRN